MKLSLGISPCPNDTFIFDALIHHKIDTEGLEFVVSYDDVETLNLKAFEGRLDVVKLSYHAFAYVANQYALLNSGSALGFGVGPLLICSGEPDKLRTQLALPGTPLKVGIPGKYTTANLLMSLAFPEVKNTEEMVFSEIEGAVLSGVIHAGLIIHENRFTYEKRGLKKIVDLGDYWEKRTGGAIPLGGIAISRKLPLEIQLKVNRALRKSVEFALAHPQSGLDFIRSKAQEMDSDVLYQHIQLYVNDYTVDLGAEGKKAIDMLFRIGMDQEIIPQISGPLFLPTA